MFPDHLPRSLTTFAVTLASMAIVAALLLISEQVFGWPKLGRLSRGIVVGARLRVLKM